MAHDPFATIHAELAALRRTVDELRRAAVPVTAVNTKDQDTPYQLNNQPWFKREDHRLGVALNAVDGIETSSETAWASTDPLGEMMELYPPPCMWLLGQRRRGWHQSRRQSHEQV